MSNNTRSISSVLDAVRAAALALALIVTAGCSARQAANPGRASAQDTAVTSLIDRDRLLTSLQTPAIMDYSGPSGHIKVREHLIVRRPANLRVEAMSPVGVALIVAIGAAQIAVFTPSDNTLLRGPANAATLAHFARIPMLPAQAVRLLLGLPPDSSAVEGTPSNSRTEGDLKILTYDVAGSGQYELGFRTGRLALVRKRDIAGKVAYEVHYSDYRDIGAIDFPFELEARFVTSATTIKLRYLNPSIDRQIADSTFVLLPGPATRLIEFGLVTPSTPPMSSG